MCARRFHVSMMVVCLLAVGVGARQTPRGGLGSIREEPLKEWLTYLSSDALGGRATYSEGLGLAAAYIADHLRQWGVWPAGDDGTYFQTVRVLGVRTTSRASITVEVNGQRRTFRDGEGVVFPRKMGGRQTLVADRVLFAGYGMSLPSARHDDYADLDPAGAVVIWIGAGPKLAGVDSRRLLSARGRTALEKGAVATVAPGGAAAIGRGARGGAADPVPPLPAAEQTQSAADRGQRRRTPDDGDFTTVQRLDAKVPPAVTADDDFFDFLFSASPTPYAELRQRAADQQPLAPFVLRNVKITFDVDADYEIVRTRYTRNVVGIVEGGDPALRDTYVVYGAHYDHNGYREGTGVDDRIYNGADDDGSGTVAIMAVARAFALGPPPKRSLLFVWHAGEENGLLGSRYMADHPVVPLESMVAQLNMDMVGRNKDDDPGRADSVFVVGSDRISTELHNLNEDANAALPRPLALDYEMNDALDPESIYTRSDHYSYAAKGIPIIFYFTGIHADYHRPGDTVDKIVFDKVVRIAQLAYETGRRAASLDHMLARDRKGPRVGRAAGGRLGPE